MVAPCHLADVTFGVQQQRSAIAAQNRALLADQQRGGAALRPAVEIVFELLSDECWQRRRRGTFLDRRVERLDVVAYYLVERRALHVAAPVGGARVARERGGARRRCACA